MMTKHYTYLISAILLASIALPLSAGAYYPTEPHLVIPGVDDAATQPVYNGNVPAPKPVSLNFDIFGSSSTSSSSTSTSKSSGSIFGNLFGSSNDNGAHDADGNAITLVSADNTTVYAIINGQKHLLPISDILALYGYQPSLVRSITPAQLAQYPRLNLIKIKGDSKHVYYLTEGNMTRLMPSTKVMDSYGVRAEDAVNISKQEFAFYPQNQYVYLESPLNRDVFQIVGGTSKRYLTPMAVQRLGITADQVAPVNQTEMDSYKILAPVVQ